MAPNEQEVVHIFSVHEPGTRSSSFVWLPVQSGHEILTDEEILEAEQQVQRHVHASTSKTAVVKYFALAGKASVGAMSDYDPHFDEPRQE